MQTIARGGSILLAFCTVVLLSGGARAQQDITYGRGARAFAMGGAGIALVQPGGSTRANPASLAFAPSNFGFQVPSLALRSTGGVSLGRVSGYLFGGQDFDDAEELAREAIREDSTIGATGGAALRYSRFEIGTQAVARGRILPNEALRNTVNNQLSPGARSDIYAGGYYTFPTLAAGFYLPTPPDSRYSYGVGVRAKYVTAVYTHFIADVNALAGNSPVQRAPEMGNKDALTKKGVAVDLGLLVQPRRGNKDFTVGVVLANALASSLRFQGTDRNGNPEDYNILATTLTAGAAYKKGGLTLVGDWTDIGQSAGDMQLRLGGEFTFLQQLSIRGGYNTANGFTWGLGFFGFDVAFGRRQPLEVVKTLDF